MATTAQKLAEYEEALKKAQSYDSNAFQNQFQKDYGEATKYNQDLINQQSTALGQLQSVAPTLRQKYANSLITNPTDQMALIAQARQAPLMDYSNAVNLLSARGNKYQDILGKALGGYQTSANQANTIAENLWRLYQDALQQDQFNAQLRASRTPAPTGPSLEDILRIAREQGNDTGTQDNGPDITVDDKYDWTNPNKGLAGYYLGSDLSNWKNMNTADKALGIASLVNPLTWGKTIGSLAGNLIGNSNTNKSFLDKLLNR